MLPRLLLVVVAGLMAGCPEVSSPTKAVAKKAAAKQAAVIDDLIDALRAGGVPCHLDETYLKDGLPVSVVSGDIGDRTPFGGMVIMALDLGVASDAKKWVSEHSVPAGSESFTWKQYVIYGHTGPMLTRAKTALR